MGVTFLTEREDIAIVERCRKDGGSYLVSWTDLKGNRRSKTIKDDLKAAQRLDARKRKMLQKPSQQNGPTFGEFATEILEGRDHGLRPITAANYLRTLISFAKPLMGQQLDRLDIREFEANLETKSASTAKYARAVVRARF